MLNNLLILQIILPLAGGLISFILSKRYSWLFATVIIGFTFVISVLLFKLSLSGEALFYNLGGWSASIGIEYKVSRLNAFFMLLISFISLVNVMGMRSLISKELNVEKYPLFFGLLLISITGLLGVCISNDIFNIYVLLEVNAIANYALVASARKPESARAAFDYLIFGTIGSTFILFGIGFIYAAVGSLNLTEISYVMPLMIKYSAVKAGVALIFFGVLMKVALFPLSSWLVNVYQGAPSFVSALFSSTTNKVGVYLLIHFYFNVFYINQVDILYLDIVLLSLSIISIIAGALLARYQTNIKRLLGYASLSQLGFIVFAVVLADKEGIFSSAISGALIYCFTHALDKTALFLSAGYLIASNSNENLRSFSGIARQYPWIFILISINLLSTVGFPLTAGFIGKWEIFKVAFASGIGYAAVIMVASIFTFIYALRFVELLIFRKPDAKINRITLLKDKSCLWVITAITILNVYLGINSQYLLSIW